MRRQPVMAQALNHVDVLTDLLFQVLKLVRKGCEIAEMQMNTGENITLTDRALHF
jgi:hypothetical protein